MVAKHGKWVRIERSRYIYGCHKITYMEKYIESFPKNIYHGDAAMMSLSKVAQNVDSGALRNIESRFP